MEENVKKYIRSLLTSTPVSLKLYDLEKDYRNTIGEPIPYHKLGYNSLEHFLRSIPETVVVRGTGHAAELVPVVTEKSAHINELVAKQKLTKGRRGPSLPRRFLLQHSSTNQKKILYPNRLGESSKSNSESREKNGSFTPITKSINKLESDKNQKSFQQTSTSNLNKSSNDNYDKNLNLLSTVKVDPEKISNLEKEVIETTKKAQNEPHMSLDENKSAVATKPVRKTFDTECGEVKRRSFRQNGISPQNILKNAPRYSFTFGVTRSGANVNDSRQNSNDLNSETTKVPPYIQRNLKKLISNHPDGVWCSELPRMYRLIFNTELNFEGYGFSSLMQMCISLSTIFHYARPSTGDIRLYDRSKPLPQNAEKKFTMASYSAEEDCDSNVALPTVDWEDLLQFLPKDILRPGADIPREFIPESTKEYDSFGIVPGEIYDISKFWVFLDNGILDDLMDNLQDFYKYHHKEYIMPEHIIREGLYCVQIIFGEYHRGLVIDILPEVEGMIKVLYIDYGTVTRTPTKGLCFLHEQFAQVPAQAIRCRLANVVPCLEGAPWSKESSKGFRKLITGRNLKATVIKVNWEEQYLDVFLVDVTDPNKTFYINDRLVEEGYAENPDKQRKKYKVDSVHKCKVKQIHLFPTFMELEHGLAPSTSEMAVFEDCGVPIYFVYPQYFDIDTTLEKIRVEQTENFYQNHIKHKREGKIHQYEISALRPKPLNLAYFGTLANELNEFMTDTNLDTSFLTELHDQTNHQLDNTDNTNIEQVTTQLQMMEFADKLKKDCLLAQDIMNDIEKLCNTNAADKLEQEFEIDPSKGFWSLNDSKECKSSEIEDFNMSFYQPEEYFSNSIPEEGCDAETVLISGQCSNSSVIDDLVDFDYEEDYLNFPPATVDNDNYEYVEEDQVALLSDEAESVMNKVINKCTNPFLEGIPDSTIEDASCSKDLILNPNNPFLTYRPNKESDESSNSTVYGGVVQEVKSQSWSIEDSKLVNVSNFEIASMHSSSTGSSHIATQTVVEDIQNDTESLEMGDSCSNSGLQTAPSNYQQKWMAGNFCEFRNKYPPQPLMYNQYNGYSYPMYPGSMHGFVPQYSSVSHYPTASYMSGFHPPPRFSQGVTASNVRPPPGFAPNSNIYQVSRVLQTTVSSNVIANGNVGNDFYDLYNARLRLAMENANNGMS